MTSMEKLRDILERAILKVASEPDKVRRRFRKRSSLNRYNQVQYTKMAVAAGVSGLGGWVVGSALTVAAAASLLRCVANMTYAYGHFVGAEVKEHDFIGVLAVWMGKMPEDVLGQVNGLVKTSRGPALAVRAARPVIERVGSEVFIKIARPLLPYIVDSLLARIALKAAMSVVPVLSSAVLIAIVTNDYANIKTAIRKYYDAKVTP